MITIVVVIGTVKTSKENDKEGLVNRTVRGLFSNPSLWSLD